MPYYDERLQQLQQQIARSNQLIHDQRAAQSKERAFGTGL